MLYARECYENATVFNNAQVDALPLQALQVMSATRANLILRKVLRYARTDWPKHVSKELHPLWRKREEMCIESDCLLWGTRVIVPEKLRKQVLKELYRAHPRIV